MKCINDEETAYRKLQRVLKTTIDDGKDEFSDDDPSFPQKEQFRLPKRVRGWHFLERASIPLKEQSGILNQAGGMNIDKLKKVMDDSLPEKVLEDIYGRASSQAPWKSHTNHKGNKFKKRRDSTHFCDDSYEEEEDANAAHEEDG